MRISITGDKALVRTLEKHLKAASVSTEASKNPGNVTEQAFGIVEAATIIAILTGAAKLVEYLVLAARYLQAGTKQKIHLKSALGTVTLELRSDITPAELLSMLKQLDPPP